MKLKRTGKIFGRVAGKTVLLTGKVAGKTAWQTGKAGFWTGKTSFGTLRNVFNIYRGKKGNESAFFCKVSMMCAGSAGVGIAIGVTLASAGTALLLAGVMLPVAGATAYLSHKTVKTPEELRNPFARYRRARSPHQ